MWTDQRQPRQERSAPLHQVPPPRSHQPRGAPTVSPGRRQTAIYAYIGSASSSSKDAQCTQACCILVKASGVWLGHCSCCCVVHKAASSVILRMCTAAAMDCTCTGRCNTVPLTCVLHTYTWAGGAQPYTQCMHPVPLTLYGNGRLLSTNPPMLYAVALRSSGIHWLNTQHCFVWRLRPHQPSSQRPGGDTHVGQTDGAPLLNSGCVDEQLATGTYQLHAAVYWAQAAAPRLLEACSLYTTTRSNG